MTYTILYGHGSADPDWLSEYEDIRAFVAERVIPRSFVRSAFLQFAEPSLMVAASDAVAAGATELLIVPVFLFSGRHVQKDVPERIAEVRDRFPDIRVVATGSLGRDPAFATLVARQVESGLVLAR